MQEISNRDVETLHGEDVIAVGGEKVGSVEDVYIDTETGVPGWVLINRGLLNMQHSLVPLVGAERAGDALRVLFTKDAVNDAPSVEADASVSKDDERRLYDHYRGNWPAAEGAAVAHIETLRPPSELRAAYGRDANL